jgi:hypothetical protein
VLTFSSDYHKLTYYYFAEAYVNFNELVTDLFKQYKVRIWMSAVNPASVVNPAGVMQVQPPSAVGPGAIVHSNAANASLAVGPGFGNNNHRGKSRSQQIMRTISNQSQVEAPNKRLRVTTTTATTPFPISFQAIILKRPSICLRGLAIINGSISRCMALFPYRLATTQMLPQAVVP